MCKLIRWLLVGVVVFLLSGCIGVSATRFSKSNIQNYSQRFEKYVGDMHALPTVDIHVYPFNSKSKTMMVLPIPIYESERTSKGDTFSFIVSIISKQTGQTLLPQDFVYVSSTSKEFTPISMTGPYDCRSQKARPLAVQPPLQSLPLSEGQCYSMLVTFAAPVPDPSELFHFIPGTLLLQNGKSSLPSIRFSESTRGNTVAIP